VVRGREDGVLREEEVNRREMGYESDGQRSRLRESFRIAKIREVVVEEKLEASGG
jgi:hypothetical protein